ncbi:MAG: hypothetical protein O9262_09115, partial [Cyclobacteriaceae bacterium]|nr:hypothetical protein [Cyclobacteriaceae bacterium]
QNTYYLYDSANRKVGEIDQNKNLTEWVYNNNGQVISTVRYQNAVIATLNATTALTNTLTTSGIKNVDTSNDRVTRKLYDAAGRLSKEIDASGYVTEYIYDGTSRLLKTIQYANALSTAQLTAINGTSGELQSINSNTIPAIDTTNDRVSRNLYSNDGLLLGTIDAERYYTKYSYDAAGRNIRIVRYSNQLQMSGTANLDSGVPQVLTTAPSGNTLYVITDNLDARASNQDIVADNIYNQAGQLIGAVDSLGYLTTYGYDSAGNLGMTHRYFNKMVGTLTTNTMPAILNYPETGIENYVIFSFEDYRSSRSYNFDNKLISSSDSANGVSVSYFYDRARNL